MTQFIPVLKELLQSFDFQYEYNQTPGYKQKQKQKHFEIKKLISRIGMEQSLDCIESVYSNPTILLKTKFGIFDLVLSPYTVSPSDTELEVIGLQDRLVKYKPNSILQTEMEDYRMKGLCRQLRSHERLETQLEWCDEFMKTIVNPNQELESLLVSYGSSMSQEAQLIGFRWLNSNYPDFFFCPSFSFGPVQRLVQEIKEGFQMEDITIRNLIFESYTELFDIRFVIALYNKYKAKEWLVQYPYMDE